MAPATEAVRQAAPIPVSAGIGLRFPHHAAFLELRPSIGWVEVHSENYLSETALRPLEKVRADYPVSLHGVGLSLGSADGVNPDHLARIRALADRIDPGMVSEHLAWSGADGAFLADLLPLPLNEESLEAVCRNVDLVQTALGRRILVENPSTYLQFASSTIPETEFLTALVARTGCGLICDVNNIVVSSSNHGWDPERYLQSLPAEAVREFHVAGHRQAEDAPLLLDTHDGPVAESVWALFELALRTIGPRPALMEWDADIPCLPVLLAEADRAQGRMDRICTGGPDVLAA